VSTYAPAHICTQDSHLSIGSWGVSHFDNALLICPKTLTELCLRTKIGGYEQSWPEGEHQRHRKARFGCTVARVGKIVPLFSSLFIKVYNETVTCMFRPFSTSSLRRRAHANDRSVGRLLRCSLRRFSGIYVLFVPRKYLERSLATGRDS
jgi:hypothetical protein